MKVSVIVPAFNAEATLDAAVHSLLATGYPDLEILVVDDGSSDSTLEVAHKIASNHSDVVRVLSHAGSAHRGVSASRNLGIRASEGELIAFLDADDVVLPNRFRVSVPMLQEHPGVDGIYELTQIENRCEQAEDGNEQWTDGSIFGIDQPLYGEDLLRKLMTGIPWGACAFLCRRSLFHRIGLFDEARTMAEDCHLWIRAAAGANIRPAKPLEVVCLYIRHEENSYIYSLERRLDLLDAMADAGEWIQKNVPAKLSIWKGGFESYLARTVLACREEGRVDIARKAIGIAFHFHLWSALFHPLVLPQIIAMWKAYCKAKLSIVSQP